MGNATMSITVGEWVITVVAKTLTLKKRGTRESYNKTYDTPHALRVITGRLMSPATNEAFLAELIRKIKKDSI
jgi:DNA-binding protein H-NS